MSFRTPQEVLANKPSDILNLQVVVDAWLSKLDAKMNVILVGNKRKIVSSLNVPLDYYANQEEFERLVRQVIRPLGYSINFADDGVGINTTGYLRYEVD